ncbi:MAG: Gfo/Idh/MocA family oxidoreductase [Lewinellaceae bacterium]|nr:Gfo/Idh/MocA family oxidoreductase [Lewinellaceae bacterium]
MTNWGIIGLGKIARQFADDLRLLPNARLHAVASTSQERAAAFAAEFGATHVYSRYEDIVHCPDLDVVYVATPHPFHCENTLLCLENGLPVLCEKPFAMNMAEARRMVGAARRNRVFLMEGLWTRFIPAIEQVFQMVEQGEIGELHTIKADLGSKCPSIELRGCLIKIWGQVRCWIWAFIPLCLRFPFLENPRLKIFVRRPLSPQPMWTNPVLLPFNILVADSR